MTSMSDPARHVLNVVCLRESLPVDGWEHYLTSMSDDGVGVFTYDRPDGTTLRVYCSADGYRHELVPPRAPFTGGQLGSSCEDYLAATQHGDGGAGGGWDGASRPIVGRR